MLKSPFADDLDRETVSCYFMVFQARLLHKNLLIDCPMFPDKFWNVLLDGHWKKSTNVTCDACLWHCKYTACNTTYSIHMYTLSQSKLWWHRSMIRSYFSRKSGSKLVGRKINIMSASQDTSQSLISSSKEHRSSHLRTTLSCVALCEVQDIVLIKTSPRFFSGIWFIPKVLPQNCPGQTLNLVVFPHAWKVSKKTWLLHIGSTISRPSDETAQVVEVQILHLSTGRWCL